MDVQSLLGDAVEDLLTYEAKGISKDVLHLPGPDFVDRVVSITDRSPQVLRNLQSAVRPRPPRRHRLRRRSCRSTRASSTPARPRSRPTRCTSTRTTSSSWPSRAAATPWPRTFGVLGAVAGKYAHKHPVHRQAQPQRAADLPQHLRPDHVRHRSSRPSTWAPPASAPRSTSAPTSRDRQIQEVAEAFARAHELGMFTVLWCYLRNSDFKVDGVDYHTSADLTGQANHLGVTIEADIIKQKLPEKNGGYKAIPSFGKTHDLVYDELTTDHPIDLCRWQVANCYMGRVGLINSGGASSGASDLAEAVQHRRHQQARRRHRADQRPQGLPASDGRGRRAAQRHPGRLPGRRHHHRLTASRSDCGRCRSRQSPVRTTWGGGSSIVQWLRARLRARANPREIP